MLNCMFVQFNKIRPIRVRLTNSLKLRCSIYMFVLTSVSFTLKQVRDQRNDWPYECRNHTLIIMLLSQIDILLAALWS